MPNPQSVYWDDWLLIFFQAATLVALVIYVWKTWHIAAETRRTAQAAIEATNEAREARLASLAPRILVYFSVEDVHQAEIVVENVGAGIAKDVQITFEPPLQSSFDLTPHNPSSPRAVEFFETVKPVMPPAYRLTHVFDSWPDYLQNQLPMRYVATVSCTGAENGRAYSVQHVLDVNAIKSLLQIHRKGIHDVAEEIKRFREAVTQQLTKLNEIQTAATADLPLAWEANSYGDSVSLLLITWRAFRASKEHERAYVNWNVIRKHLQAGALFTLVAAEREGASREVLQALASVLALLFSLRWLGHNWEADVDAAIGELSRLTGVNVGNSGAPAVSDQ
jgi:hypothetical protein